MALSMDVSLVRSHVSFLRTVHLYDGRVGLYDGPALEGALRRYLSWLELIAGRDAKAPAVVPPIDVAWVWHCHRLAPLRYAAFCEDRYGRILEPGAAAFQLCLPGAKEAAARASREAWEKAALGVGGFDAPTDAPADARADDGSADPCEPLLGYDVREASRRQRTFLWQVSGPRFEEDAFVEDALDRYEKFLRLMGLHGYRSNFWVPSYDIDLCWHTHMLASTSRYVSETAALAGEPVAHDDSVNDREAGSKLNVSWAATQRLWTDAYGADACGIAKDGGCYRGEPPESWFSGLAAQTLANSVPATPAAPPSSGLVVLDGFLHADDVTDLAALVDAGADDAERAASPRGCNVRLRAPTAVHDRLVHHLWDASVAPPRLLGGDLGLDAECREIPARAASRSVPMHRDLLDGTGPEVTGRVLVVYLRGHGTMALRDEWTGVVHRVPIEPGRLVSWPNARFTHGVTKAEEPGARLMLGPLTVLPGVDVLRGAGGGGCGGGGCGGGGCGGGGCGGGACSAGACGAGACGAGACGTGGMGGVGFIAPSRGNVPDTMDYEKEFRIYIAGPQHCKFDDVGQHARSTDRPLEEVASAHMIENPAKVFAAAEVPRDVLAKIASGFGSLPDRQSSVPLAILWLCHFPGIILSMCIQAVCFDYPAEQAFIQLAAEQDGILSSFGIKVEYVQTPAKMMKYSLDGAAASPLSQ